VMAAEITAKVTLKVRRWMPAALGAYTVAPAACGDVVRVSRCASADPIATAEAMMIGIQPAPPTSPATLPVSEYTPVPRMSPTMNSSSSFGVIAFFSAGWASPEASGPAEAVSGDSAEGSYQGRGRELDGGDGRGEPVPTREGRAMGQERCLPVTALTAPGAAPCRRRRPRRLRRLRHPRRPTARHPPRPPHCGDPGAGSAPTGGRRRS